MKMMRQSWLMTLVMVLGLGFGVASAPAQENEPAAATKPAPAVELPKQIRINLAWQIALDAVDFSPGLLDGHFVRKGNMAVSEYAAANFPGLSPFDQKVYEALQVDVAHALAKYLVTADDAAQVGMLPEDWNEKEKLKRLPYETLQEMVAEKFHCTRALLAMLNPGVDMAALDVGQELNVPNLRPLPSDNKVVVPRKPTNTGFIEVNLAQKAIRVYDKENKQIALFHCSIAKNKEKLPAEDMTVVHIAAPEPNYTFDPKNWPEVKTVDRVLIIPPGPRNPVGLAWISLSKPGYGMHGTPKPELIGKTGSHGCFRLPNWDALKLAGLVREGMLVKVVNPEKDGG